MLGFGVSLHSGYGKKRRTPGLPWYFYNIQSGLQNWRNVRSAIAAGENIIANLNFLGDSYVEGAISDDVNSRNWLTKGFPGLIRAELASRYGDVGTGFIPVFYPFWDPFWALNGSWQIADDWEIGVAQTCAICPSGTSTMTLPFVGTGLKVLYGKGGLVGQFRWKIDSGSNTTINSYSATPELGVINITGLSAGSHTLTITKVSDSAYAAIFGACPINDAPRGIRCHTMARWGKLANHFIASNAGDEPYVEEAEIDYWQPKLTIIALVANDVDAVTGIATYKSRIQTLITRAKAFGDVLLFNNAATSYVSTAQLQPYANALLDLANDNNVAYIDYSAKHGDNGLYALLGYEHDDGVHYTAAGHQDMADTLLVALLS